MNTSYSRAILLLVILASLLFTGCIQPSSPQNQTQPISPTNYTDVSTVQNTTNKTPPVIIVSINATYNMSEVIKHNTLFDCWVVVQDEVYNFTSFLSINPDDGIGQECGNDASEQFESGGMANSQITKDKLIDYDIGQLIFIEEYDDYVGPGTEPVENTTQNITQNTSMNYLDDEDIPESEIIMHNSSSDCWIVLDGIVLDITSMLSDYSDLEPLAELCGMDVTNDLDNGTLPMDEELFFEYYDEMFEHELGFVQE